MDEARREAAGGRPLPFFVTAEAQTAGRGRRGRSWASAPGNLFLTYAADFAATPGEVARLSFGAALAVADVAAAAGLGEVRLKWPNDVLVDGAKCAGILLESEPSAQGVRLYLGIGVNLAGSPGDAGYETASLGLDVAVAFAALRQRLSFWGGILASAGFEPLRQAWLARAHGLGDEIRVQIGAEALTGRFSSLAPGGELILTPPDGEDRLISAGDVFFAPIAKS